MLFFFFFQTNLLYTKKIDQQKPPHIELTNKNEKLTFLNKVAEHVNRVAPLHEYTITIPPFITITADDMHHLLSQIPYQLDKQEQQQSRKQKKRLHQQKHVSMLDMLQQTWNNIKTSIKKGKATPKTYRLLATLRDMIDTAFDVNTKNFENPKLQMFLDNAQKNSTPLIVRIATDYPTLGRKSIYPSNTDSIYHTIADVLKMYYYDNTIDQLLEKELLPNELYTQIVIQHFITQEDTTQPLVSGFCCSQDQASGAPSICILEAVYGHHAGFKHDMVAKDTYYIYEDTVIPIIRKKELRLEPNLDGVYTSITKNNIPLIQSPTLDILAAQEIGKATTFLAEYSKKPACISFIKKHNTIYLIDYYQAPELNNKQINYIDPAYIKKAIKDGAVHAVALKPVYHVITIKSPQNILFGSDVADLLEQYHKTDNSEEINVGIIERKPNLWGKEQKIVEALPFYTFWSSSSNNIKKWTQQRFLPLIIDPQTQLIFPYKRRRNFCTLFQIITTGLNGYPLPENLSVIGSFFKQLSVDQKNILEPHEFFSGVSMEYLFELLKNEQQETALQALRTILYRLQTKIKRISLNPIEKDLQSHSKTALLQALQQQYEHILSIGYKLYTMMQHTLKSVSIKSVNHYELLFLIDVFQKMITQSTNDQIVHTNSFNNLLAQIE